MNMKPWQLALVIVGFAVCIGSIIWTLNSGDEAKVNHVIHYIDVESGQIYRVDTTKNNIGIPGKNPETGKITLVRLDKKKEDGAWYVNGHDRLALGYIDKAAKNTVVDPKSGDLTVEPKSPIDYKKR